MSEPQTEIVALTPARPIELTSAQIEQVQQYLTDADLLEQLRAAIEAEGDPRIANDVAVWALADGDFRVQCELHLVTRQLLVTVQAGGQTLTVLDDRQPEALVYNRPAEARWLQFLLDQHAARAAQRAVRAAQQAAAERAAERQRQSLI